MTMEGSDLPSDAADLGLVSMSRAKLRALAEDIGVSGTARMNKQQLIRELLLANRAALEKKLQPTWWGQHHNHVYGAVTVLSLCVGIVALGPFAGWWGDPEQALPVAEEPVSVDARIAEYVAKAKRSDTQNQQRSGVEESTPQPTRESKMEFERLAAEIRSYKEVIGPLPDVGRICIAVGRLSTLPAHREESVILLKAVLEDRYFTSYDVGDEYVKISECIVAELQELSALRKEYVGWLGQ